MTHKGWHVVKTQHNQNPKPTEQNTPTKPLSGLEHWMENHASPLMTLTHSKLVENTTKFIQSKIDS